MEKTWSVTEDISSVTSNTWSVTDKVISALKIHFPRQTKFCSRRKMYCPRRKIYFPSRKKYCSSRPKWSPEAILPGFASKAPFSASQPPLTAPSPAPEPLAQPRRSRRREAQTSRPSATIQGPESRRTGFPAGREPGKAALPGSKPVTRAGRHQDFPTPMLRLPARRASSSPPPPPTLKTKRETRRPCSRRVEVEPVGVGRTVTRTGQTRSSGWPAGSSRPDQRCRCRPGQRPAQADTKPRPTRSSRRNRPCSNRRGRLRAASARP